MALKAGYDFDIVLTISDIEYGCMLQNPRGLTKRDINEFAARVSTGSPQYSDDDIYSVVWQEDWRHGFGFPHYSDEYGYAYTGDHIDTRRQGVVQLATKLTSVDASGELAHKFMDYTTSSGATTIAACGATDKGIRWTTNGTSWSAKADLDDSGTARVVYDLLDAGEYLFASQNVGRLQKMASGADISADASWTDAGNAGNPPNDFRWLAKGGGYLWGAEDGNNQLHVAGSADGSDFEGDGASDAGVIVVGLEDTAITSLCWWNNSMYVGKEDALYYIDDNQVARRTGVDVAGREDAGNFNYMTVGPDGALYFIIYDSVYRYMGRAPIDITPGAWGEWRTMRGYASGTRPPYKSYVLFHSMARVGSDIVVVGRTNDSPYEEHILYWTGSGWHKLYAPLTAGTYEIYAIGHSLATDRMYVSVGGTTTTTYAVRTRTGSDLPYDDYPTSGNHYIYFSRISLGLLDIQKYLKTLKLRSFNLNTTQTIAWAYQVDDNNSWYTHGTQNTTPYQSLSFDSTATCRTLQKRANLSTTTGAQSPYLDAYALKMLARPDTVWGYQLTLKVGDEIPDKRGRTGYKPTGRELWGALEDAREAVAPITISTPLESSKTVFVTALARVGLEEDEKGKPYEICQVSLTEA